MIVVRDALSFDDVLLVPHKSSVSSRFNGEIDLSVQLIPNVTLKYPLISANMDTVTESMMSKKMSELGGLGIIHRFMDPAQHLEQVFDNSPKILCIGAGKNGIERLIATRRRLKELDGVLIDVAHGHSNSVIEQIKNVKQVRKNLPVIAGNVATYHGAKELIMAGADCIKCGVGPGSLCTTRIQTGCGVPQLTAIMDVVKAAQEADRKVTVIADGGIKNSGDIIKALAVGADAVMIGMLFAGTKEAPGDIIKLPGKPALKVYRGMASKEAQESWKGEASSVEGEMTWINYKGPVAGIFKEIISGMLSGMSYQDAKNLEELRENAEFVKMSSAGLKESLPHGIL